MSCYLICLYFWRAFSLFICVKKYNKSFFWSLERIKKKILTQVRLYSVYKYQNLPTFVLYSCGATEPVLVSISFLHAPYVLFSWICIVQLFSVVYFLPMLASLSSIICNDIVDFFQSEHFPYILMPHSSCREQFKVFEINFISALQFLYLFCWNSIFVFDIVKISWIALQSHYDTFRKCKHSQWHIEWLLYKNVYGLISRSDRLGTLL